MKVLVFDNYDSFTYNLVHLVEKVSNATVEVHRNDKIALEDVKKFDKIILSPGPGLPSEAGILIQLVKHYAPSKSILGVCLGLQAIGESFGGRLKQLDAVFHGVATPINVLASDTLFKDIPARINVGRYHSWVIDTATVPEVLTITAVDADNNIMAASHKHYDVKGVQFHPESILSEYGEVLIKNWLAQ